MNERFVFSFLWIGALKRKERTVVKTVVEEKEQRYVFKGADHVSRRTVLARDDTSEAV